VARLPVPRAYVFSSFLLFAWWPPLLFLIKNSCFIYSIYMVILVI
jgi:hypothetical protein